MAVKDKNKDIEGSQLTPEEEYKIMKEKRSKALWIAAICVISIFMGMVLGTYFVF